MSKFNSKDFLLLLLYSPGVAETINEPISGKTRLVKAIFLFQREVWSAYKFNELFDPLPDFVPWHYGPFSPAISNDVDFFLKLGFIEPSSHLVPVEDRYTLIGAEEQGYLDAEDDDDSEISEYEEFSIQLTGRGIGYVNKHGLYSTLTDNQRDILQSFKRKINSIRLNELIRYVYTKYPDTTTNSKIKDSILS